MVSEGRSDKCSLSSATRTIRTTAKMGRRLFSPHARALSGLSRPLFNSPLAITGGEGKGQSEGRGVAARRWGITGCAAATGGGMQGADGQAQRANAGAAGQQAPLRSPGSPAHKATVVASGLSSVAAGGKGGGGAARAAGGRRERRVRAAVVS